MKVSIFFFFALIGALYANPASDEVSYETDPAMVSADGSKVDGKRTMIPPHITREECAKLVKPDVAKAAKTELDLKLPLVPSNIQVPSGAEGLVKESTVNIDPNGVTDPAAPLLQDPELIAKVQECLRMYPDLLKPKE